MIIARSTTYGRWHWRLGNVLPRLSRGCPTHSDEANAKSLSQFGQRGWWLLLALFANSADRLFGELRKVLFFSVSFVTTLLLVHIVHVGLVVAQEEMAGTNASAVVAAVQHEFVVGDGSVLEFPSDSMGHEGCEGFSQLFGGGADEPVAVLTYPSIPFPTYPSNTRNLLSVFGYTGPKPVGPWLPEFAGGSAHGSDYGQKPRRMSTSRHRYFLTDV